MKIVVSSSMKYRELIKDTMEGLKEIGLTPIFPNFDGEGDGSIDTDEEKNMLAMEHYREIDGADAVYFLTPKGYMGTSCKPELGYSIAKDKPIYFSEPTDDVGLDCYAEDFIPTDSLERFLEA